MEIEKLDLDVKTYNRLKKVGAENVEQLIIAMYQPESWRLISQPDMKRVEAAMKAAGIIKYMRGDEVNDDDIEPYPLTWDELHNYVGKLVVIDDSTESHRWLHLCWIYNIDDSGETRMSYICRGNSYCATRKMYVEEKSKHPDHPFLKHSGKFFALRDGVWQIGEKETFVSEYRYAEHPEMFGKELTYGELAALPPETKLLVYDTADEMDEDDDIYGEIWYINPCNFGTGISVYSVDQDDFMHDGSITEQQMQKTSGHIYTRVWLMNEHTESEGIGMNEIVLTEKEQAEALHNQITGYGEVIYQSLYGMCTAIKQMRDSKLYKALGYDTFEAYTDEKLGMKRRQAYSYIAIAEKLTQDFVQSTAQIGVQKLYLLTTADEETRTEIIQSTDLTDTTVKELQAQIAQLKEESELDRKERDNANADAQRWKDAAERIQRSREKAEDTVNALQEQIRELESRPIEVAVPEPSHEEQNLMEAMRKMNADQEAFNAKMQDDHIKEVQALHAQHRAETDALREEYEQKLAAAQAAPAEVPAPDSKEIFKAYLANVIDAAKRMTAFLADHPNEACRAQAEKFFSTMMREVKA